MINNAGQTVHSDDPTKAAEYNMNILNRRAATRKAPEQGAEAKQ
jgi:hypothetical protein